MNVAVTRAGFQTTVQDLGRAGYRASGVSPGGALDPIALRVANLLVGNDETAAGFEATLGTLRLRFDDDRLVAWCGGAFEVEIAGAKLRAGRQAFIRRGDELRAAASANGARAWFTISGGIDVPAVLGSRSTDVRSGFGGLDGRSLRDGDLLPLAAAKSLARPAIVGWSAPEQWANTTRRHPYLRIVRGADASRFAEATLRLLVDEPFTVTQEADRMGVRLDGRKIDRADDEELLSEPVTPGTIQVPPDGKPIVLLGDCQTIGGYPKIAHVITVDMPAAAQLRAGDIVHFAEVSLADARRLYAERERDLAWFRAGVALRRR
ncbi:MAG: biotin-dependent carboxyltransferase family protein [Chthoniobacterales bacterium]